jgi:signal transduction histidine kinase
VFNLAELVADVAGDFSLIAQEENRCVKLSGADTLAQICADPKHFRQIIHNLLTNAWKHGQGDIILRLKVTPRQTHSLVILNQVSARAHATDNTLGLGLRVVSTLLGLQPEIKCQRRRWGKLYAVRLTCPDASRLPDPGI